MKTTRRALRRHHRQRMIGRAYRTYMLRWERDPEVQRRMVLRSYNNLTRCSCWMCGNPRRYGGCLTRQERRQNQAAQAEWEECSLQGTASEGEG